MAEASGPIQEGSLNAPPSEAAGPVQESPLSTVPTQHSGPVQEGALTTTASSASGPVDERQLVALPAEFGGPIIEEGAATLPTEWSGPINEGDVVVLPPPPATPSGPIVETNLSIAAPLPTSGPIQEGELDSPDAAAGGPIQEGDLVVDGASLPPLLENVVAAQRDTSQTYLVDVGFEVGHPANADLTPVVEWRRGTSDPWQVATSQPFDRRHSVTDPITGVPTGPTDLLARNFVWNAFFDLPEGNFADVFVRVSVTNNPTTSVVVGPIVVLTETQQSVDPNLDAQLARRSNLSRTPFDFLGNGLVIPFRRGVRDFISASGIELIRSSVRQILGTRASVGELVGELPWRPDFGSKLWVLRHRQNDATLQGQAEAFVREALLQEPRVRVTDVFAESEPFAEENEVRVRVLYTVISENVEGNNVSLPEFEDEVVIGSAVTVSPVLGL